LPRRLHGGKRLQELKEEMLINYLVLPLTGYFNFCDCEFTATNLPISLNNHADKIIQKEETLFKLLLWKSGRSLKIMEITNLNIN